MSEQMVQASWLPNTWLCQVDWDYEVSERSPRLLGAWVEFHDRHGDRRTGMVEKYSITSERHESTKATIQVVEGKRPSCIIGLRRER